MADNKLFKFNLLPRKSEVEIKLIEERDNSIFYATAIVLFASVVWVVSSLVLNEVVRPRIVATQTALKTINDQIASFTPIRAKHGEIVLKARQLKPLLDKQINTELIFSVAESLSSNAGNTGIVSYQREGTGRIVFKIITADYDAIAQILANARTLSTISNLELRSSIRSSDTNLVTNTIALSINGITGTD
jgi:hypothetical protein